jgi:hypothetical protein
MNFENNDYNDYKSGVLKNRFGESIRISHFYEGSFEEEVSAGRVDVLLIEPEDGFSLLGGMREYLSTKLALERRNLAKWILEGMKADFEINISSLADWARFTDPDVTLIGIPSRNLASSLKGLILIPYEGSLCYKRFAQPKIGKPYRDFFITSHGRECTLRIPCWGRGNLLFLIYLAQSTCAKVSAWI